MKRKVLAILAALSLGASVGYASPLKDFSAGKGAVDVAALPGGKIHVSDRWGSADYDKKDTWQYGITVGVGNNLAVQYATSSPVTRDYRIFFGNLNIKLDTQDFNVLYKLNNNYTVFTGINQVKATHSYSAVARDFKGDTKTNWQIGVTGQVPLGKSVTGFATVSVGGDTTKWSIGTSYTIDKNVDFNLFYSESKYNKVAYNDLVAPVIGATADYKVNGLGYGVTFRF